MKEGRRAFLERLTKSTTSTYMAVAYVPTLVPAGIDFAVNKAREARTPTREKLARRLTQWRLPTGELMSDIVPEVDIVAQWLSTESLEKLNPFFRREIPVSYVDNLSGVGALTITPTFSRNTEHKITVTGNDGKIFDNPVVTEIELGCMLDGRLKGTNAELVVVTKEIMQAVHLLDYAKRYKHLVDKNSAQYTVQTASGFPAMSEDQLALSLGMYQLRIEADKGRTPWFRLFADAGTMLTVGGILYSNWQQNYPQEQRVVPPLFLPAGNKGKDFLERKGLITKKTPNVTVWTNGRGLEVNSVEFAKLYSEFTGFPLE